MYTWSLIPSPAPWTLYSVRVVCLSPISVWRPFVLTCSPTHGVLTLTCITGFHTFRELHLLGKCLAFCYGFCSFYHLSSTGTGKQLCHYHMLMLLVYCVISHLISIILNVMLYVYDWPRKVFSYNSGFWGVLWFAVGRERHGFHLVPVFPAIIAFQWC